MNENEIIDGNDIRIIRDSIDEWLAQAKKGDRKIVARKNRRLEQSAIRYAQELTDKGKARLVTRGNDRILVAL